MTLQNPQNNSPEVKEPSPKVQKIHQNGASVETPIALPLFKVKKLSKNAVLPSRGSALSLRVMIFRGKDLRVDFSCAGVYEVWTKIINCLGLTNFWFSATEMKVLARGKALVTIDLSIAIPEGTYAHVAPRSGLAWTHSIDVGAGVIDADYRGPLRVILFNHSGVDFEVKKGDRIAQLVIERIMTPEVMEIEDLDSTVRGFGGFGSIGV